MTKLLILLTILLGFALTACGPANEFCSINYDQANGFCDTVVGYETRQDIDKNKQDISDTKKELSDLEEKLDTLYAILFISTNNLSTYVAQLNNQVSNLTTNQSQLQVLLQTNTSNIYSALNQIQVLDNDLYATTTAINAIQSQVWNQQIQITYLLSKDSPPIEIIDFCGDTPGKYDEIGIKLANGDLVVFFKDSGTEKYFLTKLIPGNYVTTDKTNCTFVMHSDGTVTW